jgi:hypothetical protein
MSFLTDFLLSKSIYSSSPYYEYPFKNRFNKDFQSILLIFFILWKIYYYSSDNNSSVFEKTLLNYTSYENIVNSINSTINYIVYTFIILYLLFLLIKKN